MKHLVVQGSTSFEGFDAGYVYTAIDSDPYPPIVLLSGVFQNSGSSWGPVTRALKKRRSTIALMLPGGYGAGKLLQRHFDFTWLARCAIHVLNELLVEKVDVLALSYGTPVAICLAVEYPNRIRRVALSGATDQFPEPAIAIMKMAIDFVVQGHIQHFTSLTVSVGLLNTDPRIEITRRDRVAKMLWLQLSRLTDHEAKAFVENTHRVIYFVNNVLKGLARPECPTLGFTGLHDTFTPADGCRRLLQSFPNGVFTAIEKSDHLAFIENTEVALGLVDTFFNDSDIKQIEGCTSYEWSSSGSPDAFSRSTNGVANIVTK